MITVRRATADDAPIIAEHNRRLAWESEQKTLNPAESLAGVVAALADPEGKGPYYLACEGDAVVGQCQVTWEWGDWRNGWFWWIQSVYVRADYRRRGVFRTIYQRVRRDAVEAGNVLAMRLYVERDNHPARAVYEQLGLTMEHYDMMRDELK
jgi:GNAT superfamily N-acetyltransferase